jgi:hypothetical protein
MRAQVTIHETVESSPARQSINTLRVGEETPPPEPYSYQPPQLNDIDVDFEVEIEADARIVDGEYVGLTYASAKMGERIAG